MLNIQCCVSSFICGCTPCNLSEIEILSNINSSNLKTIALIQDEIKGAGFESAVTKFSISSTSSYNLRFKPYNSGSSVLTGNTWESSIFSQYNGTGNTTNSRDFTDYLMGAYFSGDGYPYANNTYVLSALL